MSLIKISNLTFCYDGSFENIFEDVSFQIDTDWKLGFTGRNGRGKTTFLNLLMGKYEHKGVISASVNFDYFPFEVADKSKDTLEIINKIVSGCMLWKLQKELSLLNVSEDVIYRPFYTLSSGEQTKVLLAGLFIKDNNFLLIDEPTNHLDIEARKVVSRYLNSKKGFILVSHDRAFLDDCIDHILCINKKDIEIQRGNYSSWQNNKRMQDEFEIAENEKLKRDVEKLSKAAKRTAGWSDKLEKTKKGDLNAEIKPDRGYIGHKSAKMMKRSKVIQEHKQNAIEKKSKLLKNIDSADSLIIHPLVYNKNVLLDIRDLTVFYGEKKACEHISFQVNSGDRVSLCGRNGAGKSSILRLLIGDKINFTGELNIGSNLIISYIPQDASYLEGGLKEFAEKQMIDESLFKAILRKLDFAREQFEKDMGDYSAGQKKKILLAHSLCKSAHLYIWDEPLNYIDILSRMQIEELILKYCPTMIFVEHDRSFNDAIATKRVEL